MRVVFTDRSRRDLRAIAFYIARDDVAKARSFVSALRAKSIEIGKNPLAFPNLQKFRDRGVRRRVFGRYLIFYRFAGDTVVILRILHGARNHDDLLGA
jgi:plasmid stabilization system protein ParE